MIVERTGEPAAGFRTPTWWPTRSAHRRPDRRQRRHRSADRPAEREGSRSAHFLVTHPHADHIAGIKEARERLGGPPLVAHEATAAEMDEEVEIIMGDGDKLDANGIEIEGDLYPRPRARPPRLPDRRHRRLHRRRPLQGHGRRLCAPGRGGLRCPQGLGHAA